jgi:hypothetical protein
VGDDVELGVLSPNRETCREKQNRCKRVSHGF